MAVTEQCEHCGDSGILNIVFSATWDEWSLATSDTAYATACHCARGAEMSEVMG